MMTTKADSLRDQHHEGGPPYFDLLWDSDLDELIPLLDAIARSRRQVLERWHDLYLLYFGDRRALSRADFFRIYGADLDATVKGFREKAMGRFVAEISRIGELLVESHVPFSEVVVSMHLFEESASSTFPPGAPSEVYRLFDKISHCRTVILAETYFRSRTATSAVRIRQLEKEAAQLPAGTRARFHGLVGASSPMRRLYEQIEAAAGVRSTVLLVGETGSGKELVARALHECSAAARGPFVALNCAAVARDLIESELFGHMRGAFSGATGDYAGLFRAAQGGTLFLDEITEMSTETQSKLLRAIQERTVRPVGATREVSVNARLIASTNRDPRAATQEGRLREDLYYRLHVNVLRVPSLRERLDDIPLLVDHFVQLFNERLERKIPITTVEPEALNALQRHVWPGNVRELANIIEAAFTFNSSESIALKDLPESIHDGSQAAPPTSEQSGTAFSLADAERDVISRALESTKGNKCRAAEMLGISRKMLYARIAKYRLSSPRHSK